MSLSLNTAQTPSEIEDITKTAMQNAVGSFKKQLEKLHTGRASTALLENIHVPQPYGGTQLLSRMATITVVDSQTLNVTVWDKSLQSAAQKAMMQSDLHLNPAVQGDFLRVRLPPLSDERRKDTTKMINKMAEEMCEEVRNHRRAANNRSKELSKDKTMSEDEEHRLQKNIQKLTDEYVKQIKTTSEEKNRQVMGNN